MPTTAQMTPPLTVIGREWQRLRGDFWDMSMLSWIPLCLYLLTWWIFSAGVPRDLPVAIVDHDQSAISRQLARWLDSSPGIRLISADSETDAIHLIRERQAYGVIVLPRDFEGNVLAGRSSNVQWFYNAQFSSHVGALGRDVRTVAATLSAGIEIAGRGKRGMSTVQAAQQFEPIRTRLVSLFNENSNYEQFLGMALIPSLLQIFLVVAVVTAIGKEFRDSSVSLWLESANHSWSRAVLGKLLFPFISFLVQGLLFIIFFAAVRGWEISGSATAIIVSMFLFVLAYLGMGVFLIAATLSLRNALSAAAFVTAPAFAYAGQGFPLQSMPMLAKIWANTLPLTHYLQLQTSHWAAGAPFRYGINNMLTLVAFAIISTALGILLLRLRGNQPANWGKT